MLELYLYLLAGALCSHDILQHECRRLVGHQRAKHGLERGLRFSILPERIHVEAINSP